MAPIKEPLKKCLLVADDPDDHIAFSDAVSEIASDTVVLIMLDSEKALQLLADTHPVDYIFLDLSMHGMRVNSFLKALKNETELSRIPTILYGSVSELSYDVSNDNLIFFNKDYEYSELKAFLKKVLLK